MTITNRQKETTATEKLKVNVAFSKHHKEILVVLCGFVCRNCHLNMSSGLFYLALPLKFFYPFLFISYFFIKFCFFWRQNYFLRKAISCFSVFFLKYSLWFGKRQLSCYINKKASVTTNVVTVFRDASILNLYISRKITCKPRFH